MLPVEIPFKTYTDLHGNPLNNGYVFFGVVNQNSITSPVPVFWDAAGTQPAFQPLRTMNGYIVRNGTPANAFINVAYSEMVQDSRGRQVFYAPDSHNFGVGTLVNEFFASISGQNGAANIGYSESGTGAITWDVQSKLREIPSVTGFGTVGDGVADDTVAFQSAVAAHQNLIVPSGTYILNSVNITQNLTLTCSPGVIFKRKNGSDLESGGFNFSTGMFTIELNGVSLRILGAPTFDGNRANQTAVEPSGFSIMVKVESGNFINGTSGYLSLRGDDIQRRYRVLCKLDKCRFADTAFGKGKGDPATPTALGYSPTMIFCLDYVTLTTHDFYGKFSQATGTGLYACCAILGTFTGTSATAGSPSVFMYGTTETINLGRSAKKFDDNNNYTFNNGIGVVDLYGDGEEVLVENIIGRSNQSPTVRAKASLARFTVGTAYLENCFRGLQVGPSTTGVAETVVNVGSLTTVNGSIPQIEFTGTTAVTDILKSVTLGSIYCSGTVTNPEVLAGVGNIHFRNVSKISGTSLTSIGSPTYGISIEAVERCNISDIVTNSTTLEGIICYSATELTIENFDIRNAGAAGIQIAGAVPKFTIGQGRINNTVNYGILNQNTSGYGSIHGVSLLNVSGLSRGFYTAGGRVFMTYNSTDGVTTPLFPIATTLLTERDNSWNPREVQGSFTTTSSGTWAVGDKVWNTTPVAGGTVGWVCTTAGSPGTFKTFGTIAP